MSTFAQTIESKTVTFVLMESDVRIVAVERDDPDGSIVTFSDGTIGAFVVEELLALRPHRESAKD
jgi:hypothetical protein